MTSGIRVSVNATRDFFTCNGTSVVPGQFLNQLLSDLISNPMEQSPIKPVHLAVIQEITWPFTEHEFSLPCPQNPLICPCTKPDVTHPFEYLNILPYKTHS